MKYVKVQTELLKEIAIREVGGMSSNRCLYCEYENRIGIFLTGNWGMFIPKDLFFIDKEKLEKHIKKFDFNDLIKMAKLETIPKERVVDTGIILEDDLVIYNGKKVKQHKFTINNEDIYINNDFLKYFDKDVYKITGTNHKSPIFLWGNDGFGSSNDLLGIVLPINKIQD